MTPEQLRLIVPSMPMDLATTGAAALNSAMARYNISATSQRQAYFVAQVLHETNGFMKMSESFDYAPDRLLLIWPSHFTPETARMYGRIDHVKPANQAMIANIAYANRMGNGSIESGDGWRYRGRGPGLTGRENYRKCGAALGINIEAVPDQVSLPNLGCAAFAWFWSVHGCNAMADAGDIVRLRVAINGGDIGLQACIDLTDHCMRVLNESGITT